MTCIVLTRNPLGGGVLALMDDGGEGDNIAQWPDVKAARDSAAEQTLVRAWGGWIVDLDALEVIEV